ncbi:Placental protein 11 [Handroanthus impetiginosus]|uniref:Placental protein 11 n=1 Tax=Handroanthus impetiginosus TaxID=429701 RepID=A0A2G9HKR9_9LAMI|nr:Placental protein 11 [Handroanthus impetiginosus]
MLYLSCDKSAQFDGRDSQPQEERSKSSWAQVVPGETKDHDGSSSKADHRTRPSQTRREERYGRNEERESGESQPVMRTSQEGDERNDGGRTVQKKPSKRRHKVHKDQWNNYKRPSEEQEYSSDVNWGSEIRPSHEELVDLSKALNKLWELDFNRLVPGKDYEIDCGEGKKVYQKEDMAEGSLFSWLSDEVFKKPTYSRLCSLLDNYIPQDWYEEVVTPEEEQEQAAFIEEISRTAPIKYLYNYLSARGIVSGSYQDFNRMLTSLWFDLYGRGGASGSSSAFEHVFVGEIRQRGQQERGQQEVSGFHNWIQPENRTRDQKEKLGILTRKCNRLRSSMHRILKIFSKEAKGRVDYQGYIFPRRQGNVPDSETQLLTIQFKWNDVLKSVSSTLIGVSPEFEIAIYTLCFYLGGEDNHVQLGPYPVNIKCYRLENKLGSAFPVADS